MSTNALITLGIILMLLGFFVLVFGLLKEWKKGKVETKYGGLILIGPFPLVFGNDKGLVELSIILLFLFLFLVLLWLFLPRILY